MQGGKALKDSSDGRIRHLPDDPGPRGGEGPPGGYPRPGRRSIRAARRRRESRSTEHHGPKQAQADNTPNPQSGELAGNPGYALSSYVAFSPLLRHGLLTGRRTFRPREE